MKLRNAALAAIGVIVVASTLVIAAAAGPAQTQLTHLPSANTRSTGYAPASVLSPELAQIAVAQGSTKVENPSAEISYYGYDNDVLGPSGDPQMVPTPAVANEAHKTEPDKNTYLVFEKGLPGSDPAYDYGTHFLFQGHETGSPGYITRINLDADAAHRVTVLATRDVNANPIADIDGSTWEPFARRLLFTTENPAAPTYAATPGFPSQVEDVSGALGRGGYEGIQDDSDGNIWIVEDIGGSNKSGTTAKRLNSFVYRYVPERRGDLHNGKLQALQVLNAAGSPITFDSQLALASLDQVALHTYGNSLATRWVTIHDTNVDGKASFNANVLAKAAQATPFKRPENGVFRPDSHFGEFYFDETGDTNATSAENTCCGGWGSVLKLTQSDPSADTGSITMFYRGDQAHSGFDNAAFFSRNLISFVEDAGDTLHGQRNALDSGYVLDVSADYANPANVPLRWLAEGRDPSATIDAANGGFGKNDGDNEITGLYVSDGDPTKDAILGQHVPHQWEADGKWRVFYTQQHGDNWTYEVVRIKN
jgi:hypothetical protein